MKLFTYLLLAVSLAATGCGPATTHKETEAVSPSRKETVWTVIADRIDHGSKRYPNTHILELEVDVLREDGSITDNEVDAFYEALPGIKEKQRELTSSDANAIRSIRP